MPRWLMLPAYAVALLPALVFWWWQGGAVDVVDAPSARVPCVSYAPYRAGQSPLDDALVIPEAQIAEDLDRLAGVTDCVRTYAQVQGLDAVPRLAAERGITVMLGAWIGREREKNERELASVIALAQRYPETVRAVIVGNEVLLRQEQPPAELAAMIERVRAAVRVPVTYADVWEFWERNPEIAAAVDFVTIHTLPYWEDDPRPIEDAVPHVLETWRHIQRLFPGEPVFIGEAGWPSAGRMREGARPGIVEQARFVRGLMAVAAQEGIGLNVIESFDQPWKRRFEGTVGGHWGLIDADRRTKFALAGPVSAEPNWRRRFGISALTGLLLLVAAMSASAASAISPARWVLAALAASAAGSLLTVGVDDGLASARTAWDWLVLAIRTASGAAAAGLVFAAILGADGSRPVPIAALVTWLRGSGRPAAGRVHTALGLVRALALFGFAATTLCLVFEGRYRDFPVALYAVPAGAFLMLALMRLIDEAEIPGLTDAVAGTDGAGGAFAEEWLLAVTAVGGALIVVVMEGPANVQALGWLAVAGAFLAAFALDARAVAGLYRRSSARDPSSKPPAAGSAA